MSHHAKTLTEPCACAAWADAMWFMANPDRAKYVRNPYSCEAADNLSEEAKAYVSQVVCVWIEQSINEQTKARDDSLSGLVHLKVTRRSFLFTGKTQPVCRSDADVERFMVFIDDSPDALPSLSIN